MTIPLAQRRRIVGFHQRGYTVPEIARAMDCDPHTARRWIHRYQQAGDLGLHSSPHHKALPPWVRRRIVQLKAEQPHLSANAIARILTPEVYPNNGARLRHQTVLDILEEEAEP